MRIISFMQKWPKLCLDRPALERPEFTTFRSFYWQAGWPVQVFYKARSKYRVKLGEAMITNVEGRELDIWIANKGWNHYPLVTDKEAQEDGFSGLDEMATFMQRLYGLDFIGVMAKLTLRWTSDDCSK